MRRWFCGYAWEDENGNRFDFDFEYRCDGGKLGSCDPADQPEIEILDVVVLSPPVREDGTLWTKEETEAYLDDQLKRGGKLWEELVEVAYDDAACCD